MLVSIICAYQVIKSCGHPCMPNSMMDSKSLVTCYHWPIALIRNCNSCNTQSRREIAYTLLNSDSVL